MNAKGTEFSIFQSAPSIHVDNNQERIEEEEDLRDQKRRHAELNNELQNAFEDLEEDEEVDETGNSTKLSNGYSHHKRNHPKHNNLPQQHEQAFSLRGKETHLKNMIDSRDREIDYVTAKLTNESKQHKSLIDSYEKRLAIAEAEKERAQMTKDHSHQLLVESKGKNIELEEVNGKLQSKIRSLESENSNLVGELEGTKLMLSDVQIKYNMVEKNVISKADRNTDTILRQAQERHNAQIAMMQQQFDSLKSKHEEMEHEYKNLDIRYKELQRSRESMLIEKSEIINMLNKNLEDAQRQCQDLLSRPNYSQENKQLQNLIRSIDSQKEEMSRTIGNLQKRLQEQTAEMELMDSIVHECGGNNGSFLESTKFIQRDPLKNVNSSIPLAPEARLARVKDELCKSLNNIKNKREEIKILEIQLREKDDEIKTLKVDENKALFQMNHYRDETIRLESKLKIFDKEIKQARQELLQKSASNTDLTDEKYEEKLRSLRAENEVLVTELKCIKADYESLSMKNGELMENENEWKEKVQQLESLQVSSEMEEQLKQERDRVQSLNEQIKKYQQKIQHIDQATQADTETDILTNACQMCEKSEKLQTSGLQYKNGNDDNPGELNHLKNELIDAHKEIKYLEEKLNLKELRDQEIEMLKKKSQEFEEYIRSNTRSGSVASSGKSSLSPHTKTYVSTETLADSNNDQSHKVRQIETKIRDEMAKIFAAESKTMEKAFREEVGRLRNSLAEITHYLEEKSEELTVRNEQLELLKFTILSEREESAKIINQKDEDFKVAIEKYRAEYENNQQKIEDLMSNLKEKEELIDEERKSIESLKMQLNEERESLKMREESAVNKYQKLQLESEKTIKQLNEKYSSAKRTAMNYKQYSEDKESHFRKECERNKSACVTAVEKVQKEAKAALLEKDKVHKEKIIKMETEFEYKVDILKEMLAKSSN